MNENWLYIVKGSKWWSVGPSGQGEGRRGTWKLCWDYPYLLYNIFPPKTYSHIITFPIGLRKVVPSTFIIATAEALN